MAMYGQFGLVLFMDVFRIDTPISMFLALSIIQQPFFAFSKLSCPFDGIQQQQEHQQQNNC